MIIIRSHVGHILLKQDGQTQMRHRNFRNISSTVFICYYALLLVQKLNKY